MENLREYLNSFTKEDYKNNKINLHIHTTYSDGKGNPNQIIESAKKQNYKIMSITDHNTVEVHKYAKDEILLTGVEFDCWFAWNSSCFHRHVWLDNGNGWIAFVVFYIWIISALRVCLLRLCEINWIWNVEFDLRL